MREKVIEQAYHCAMSYDIEDVSLVKISSELNISRRSIYRMFTNKNELAFEVYKIVIDELLSEAHDLNKFNKCSDGYNLTLEAMQNMIKVFLNNPKKINYVTKFDAINIIDKNILEDKNDFYRKCDFTYGFLKQGVSDKSIKPTIEPYKMSCIILETILGVVSRFHILDKEEYVDYMCREDIYELVNVFKCYLRNQ